MTSIITGDIINSRKSVSTARWLNALKTELNEHGTSPKTWEIYRGDSFQLEIKKPEEAFLSAIKIKARIKAIKDLNVRISIGLGAKSYNAAHITQSNGSAFINSGEAFDKLASSRQTILVQSTSHDFDYSINTMLLLLSSFIDNWSVSSAGFISLALTHKNLSQKELGKKMKIAQSSVSERQKRSRLDEVLEVDAFYRYKLTQIKK